MIPYSLLTRVKTSLCSALSVLGLSLCFFMTPLSAHAACNFLIPDQHGNAVAGPSFDLMRDGFTRGVLECGSETHGLMVMTIDIDTSLDHVGVRDDPLFSVDVIGALESVRDVTISSTSKVHVMGRVKQSPRIGMRRGFVHFATLCDARGTPDPLNCSWGKSRIKFRSTTLDTNADDVFDRTYHELSVYNAAGRLHMITFWTPHRGEIKNTADDWISALQAFGLDVASAG